MKRTIIHVCFAAIVALIFAAAADAQVGRQYRADIPFEFTLNGESFEAGEYTVGPLSGNSTQLPLALRHVKSGDTDIIGLVQAQGGNGERKGHIYFTEVNGRYELIQVSTPTFEMKKKRARTDVRIVKDRRLGRTVAIAMN